MIKHRRITHDIYQLLPELRAELEEKAEVLFAYLFGSYGRGRPGPLSDVDIAVFVDQDHLKNLWELKLHLVGLMNDTLKTDEVDLVILNEANLSLQYHVRRTGRLLFSKDEAQRVAFETRTIRLYLDAEPLRQQSWRAMVKRIREGRYGR